MSSGFIEKIQNNIHNKCMEDRHKQKLSYPLRMSDELRASLEGAANKIGRSLHAEIIARLEESISNSDAIPGNLIEAIQSEAKSKGYLFSINFGEQPSISTQFEGAYRRGYHQGVAEVAYCMEEKKITNAEQLLVWVQGSGMVWRKDLPLDKMTPPPPFIE